MSALGRQRTFAVHQDMSALPPIATAKADMGRKLMAAKYQPRKQTGAYQIPNGSAVAAAYD
jgi:hypothetical protein